MEKRTLLAFFHLAFFAGASLAQTTVLHPNNTGIQNITVSPGTAVTYYDDGGVSGNYSGYSDFQTSIVTFSPAGAGQKIKVEFTFFSTEDYYDALFIYNGNAAETPLLTNTGVYTPLPNQFNSGSSQGATNRAGGFMGSGLPGPFVSTAPSGALTFQFQSDCCFSLPGWAAVITSECTTTTANDLGVASIDTFGYLCPGTYPVYAKVQNFGTSQVSSFTLGWEFDGVAQTPLAWNAGVLDTCGGALSPVTTVYLGDKPFAAGAAPVIRAWTSQPNGSADPANGNDTLALTVAPALSGTYTIGGTSPDFPSFSAAVAALATQGVCDSVVFNVRDGIYNEQVSIPEIPGADSLRPVIFQSESGDSTLVTLTYASDNYAFNYTLRLAGADWITFREITLEATGSYLGRVVEITGGANHNSLLNCVVKGVSTLNTYIDYALVALEAGAPKEFNVFRNNHFLNGSFGLALVGNYNTLQQGAISSTLARGLEVTGNAFENQSYAGMSLGSLSHPVVHGNLITSSTSNYFFVGIELSNIQDGLEVTSNQVKDISSESCTGINISYAAGDFSNPCLVANNFVQIGNPGASNGFYLSSDDASHIILHNTVRVTSTNPFSVAFNDGFGLEKTLRNNILSNTGGGRAIQLNGLINSDYNDLHATGGTLAIFASTNYADLAAWQAGTGLDSNSLSVDPFFLAPGDFHITAIELNGAGQAAPLVGSDLDGQARNVATPDIGADEFSPFALDAVLSAFASPTIPFGPGTQNFEVVLKNNGADSLSSTTIHWVINGVAQSPASWTGSLASGQLDTVSLGSATFLPGVLNDLLVFSSMPNGMADQNPGNDSLRVDDVYTAMAGVYTIGGTSPDFPDFASAVASLHLLGVADSVVFNVRNGTYYEQVSINQVQGAGSSRPVIFQSESGDSSQVTLYYEAFSYDFNFTLRLNGADWIRFHQLTIQAGGGSYARAVDIAQSANNNTLSNCRLISVWTFNLSNLRSVVFQGDYTPCEFNVFENNRITNGSNGIYISGVSDSGLQVKGNTFENQYYAAVFIYNCNAPLIHGNEITTNSSYSNFFGIYASYSASATVTGNKLPGLNSGGTGISLEYVSGLPGQPALVANNYVLVGGAAASKGINSYEGSHHQILYNTVHVTNGNISSQAFSCTYGSSKTVKNNIFANTGNGGAFLYYPPGIIASDFNDLYSSGPTLCNFNGGSIANLAGWQGATGLDGSSFSVNPAFDTIGSYVVGEPQLNGSAQPSALVSSDIEGNPRDATAPDMGVLEFSPPANEAALLSFSSPSAPFAPGPQAVAVNLRNNGSNPITSITLDWQVNGAGQPPVNWTGNLAGGATTSVSLGSFTFNLGSSYDLKAWLSLPNGLPDPYPSNDTTSLENQSSALAGVYTIGGTAPDFPTFTAAVDALHAGGVVGAVTFNVRNGAYFEQITINQVAGADSLRSITFQSESGDSSQVVLGAFGNFTNNYVLLLNGADWVNFRKLTIEQLSTFYGQAIVVQSGSRHIQFTNNLIKTADLDYTNVNIYNPGGEHLLFRNNDFLMGYYGLLINGGYSSSQFINGIVVEDNLFRNQYDICLNVNGANHPVARGNEMRGSRRGIFAYSVNLGAELTGNFIHNVTETGIALESVSGTPAAPVLVANNFIQVGGSSQAYGIWDYSGSQHEIAHNSIHMTNSNPSSYGFANSYGSLKTVRNNIFANSGGGPAYYNLNPSAIPVSDHNDLFSSGPVLGYWNSNHASLAAWVAATQRDSNSLSVNPAFFSTTDLHTSLPALDAAGTPLTFVSTDFDGDLRDPAMPDIGADEFAVSNEDAGLASIDYPSGQFPSGLQPVLVTLFNNGLDTLETVTVQWEVNGTAQAPFSWSGALLSGEMADSLVLGAYLFAVGNSYDIRAWTSLPNGLPDTINLNDTVQVLDLRPALGGFYTIGGPAPDFPDFTQAVGELVLGGVIDSVVFNVRNGTYAEQLVIPQIPGAGASRPITFQSESGDSSAVVLTFENNANSSSNFTLRLNGADHLRFRRMTIQGTGYYNRGVELLNGANSNRFERCQVLSPNYNYELVYSPGNFPNDNNNEFLHNRFSKGATGLYLNGNYSRDTGVVIIHNRFEDQYYQAVYLRYQQTPLVASNKITTSSPNTFHGIFTYSCTNNIRVLNNDIGTLPSGVGIYLSDCINAAGQEGLVANNFVHTATNNYGAIGIGAVYSSRLRIYHNNVNNASIHSSTQAFYNYSSSFLKLRNNVLASTGGGYAITSYYDSSFESNHNDLFTNGSALGSWQGASAASLSDWQAASGQDLNSISADPIFTSASDLHVSQSDLNQAGTPLPEVTLDIDAEPRDPLAPDIGADEFAPTAFNDAGVAAILSPNNITPFASGNQDVTVAVKNNGVDTLYSLTVQWSVNNIPQAPFAWSGTLLPGERDTVAVGAYSFPIGTSHDLLAYTENPNGMPDTTNYNDTTLVKDLWAALGGVYTLGGSLPDFIDFSSAVNAINRGGVVAAVTFNVRGGIYNESIQVNAIKGSSPANSVTFQSETLDTADVRLTATYNTLVTLNGADNVTFRHLTLEKTVWGEVVVLSNGANNIRLLDNRIRSTYYYSFYYDLVQSGTSLDNGTVIARNSFEGGRFAINLSGQGTSTAYLESGIVIEDNTMANCENGIGLSYQNAPVVRRNTIQAGYQGINLYYSRNLFRLSENRLSLQPGGSNSYGIIVSGSEGSTGNRGLIANNFIHVGGSGICFGLYFNGGASFDCHYNNVNITNTNSASRACYNSFGSGKNLLNNIFANPGGGYSIYVDGSSGIASSDHNDLFTTGPNLGFWNGTNANNLPLYRVLSGREANSLSVNPLFFSDSDLHILQTQLDSAATVIAGLSQDIDGQPRNATHPDIGADEIAFLPDDLGVSMLVTPANACTLTGSETVTVKVQNYSSSPLSGFSVAYSLNGGTPVVQSAGALTVAPGATANFTFSATANMASPGLYDLSAWTIFAADTNQVNDTLHAVINHAGSPGVPANLIPVNGAASLPLNITFSWSPSVSATKYDLYIWPAAGSPPPAPTAANISQISYYFYGQSFFNYGQSYKWQIVAKNNFCTTPGPVQEFTILNLPDLIVNAVTAPSTAFSGQSVTLSFEVKNTGSGGTGTGAGWYDAFYLSLDQVLDPFVDTYLGAVSNFSSLGAGQSYSNTASYVLPNGISGNYYLFVHANAFSYLTEQSSNNNTKVSNAMAVTLTPPPDLQVASIVTPANAFSGTTLSINTTIKNFGTGETKSGGWQDALYLSSSTVLDIASATFLGTNYHSGNLEPDSSYSFNRTASLPNGISGNHYIHVVTDFYNNEYEHGSELNNNGVSPAFNIILTPPPDLQVTSVTAPASASNKQQVTVSWTVENLGGSLASGYWVDRVYLSQDPAVTNFSSLVPLGDRFRPDDLDPGESYNSSLQVTVPDNITGNYYFYIFADGSDNIYEFNLNNNNSTRAPGATNLRTPDLSVHGINATGPAFSGDTVNVSWKVRNTGTGALLSGSWSEKVYLYTGATFNPAAATQLATLGQSGTLQPNDSLSRSVNVILPNGISGNYHLYVWADAGAAVYENGSESNNYNNNGIPLPVTLSPYPDLNPSAITVQAAASAGALIPVTWTVKNNGTGPAQGIAWKDKIYISANPVLNLSNAQLVRTEDVALALAKDSSYQKTALVVVPVNLAGGNYYFHVFTDQENKVYEYLFENNNKEGSTPVAVTGYPPVDLAVVSAMAPSSANSGQSISVSWTVENLAAFQTISPNWIDAVFLSSDQVYSPATDVLLGTRQQSGPLPPGTTYAASLSVTIPNGTSGPFYLIVRADRTGLNNDSNLANNAKVVTDGGGNNQSVTISLTPPPDLQVANLVIPPQGFSGQPVGIAYTVQNNGTGATTPGSWTDRFFLSTDLVLDANDHQLGTLVHSGNLMPGQSYTDTASLFLPSGLAGNRIVILKTDANDGVYEYSGENNNTASGSILVVLPPPSDLVVPLVTVPASAIAGKQVVINWNLKNQGANPASGYTKEAVFFSKDATWDVGDALLGVSELSLGLAPGATMGRSLTANLTNVSLGDYYAIVRTDILDNIPESNEGNNQKLSGSKTNVNVLELPLNVLKADTLLDNRELYYRIEIADSLAEESLLVTLKGDSINGNNELYLKRSQVPTRASFDHAYTAPFAGNQEVVVPSLLAGTYYLMAYGKRVSPAYQPISLLARKLNFEIRSISADHGGNTGKVTTVIEGAKFEPSTVFQLVKGSDVIQAEAVVFVNPTKVFATFDLNGEATGLYDVVAIRQDGQTATLDDGFEVVTGQAPQLSATVVQPANVATQRVVSFRVEFVNSGNVDITDPEVMLSSMSGASISLDQAGLADNLTVLTLELEEQGGPPGVLRPGAAGSIIVYTRSDVGLGFLLTLPSFN